MNGEDTVAPALIGTRTESLGRSIAVMFQKVASRKAIVGALTAFVLLFAFSWLALKLAGLIHLFVFWPTHSCGTRSLLE